MTVLLRQMARSAEGREIVRASRVEGDRLTIGRGPECDIHLTDLAVALHHATVERTGDRLSVRTAYALYVDLNGRKATEGSFDLHVGGDIRSASHRIRVLPGAARAAVSVAISRVAEAGSKDIGGESGRGSGAQN